jgi:hypothetical protein
MVRAATNLAMQLVTVRVLIPWHDRACREVKLGTPALWLPHLRFSASYFCWLSMWKMEVLRASISF